MLPNNADQAQASMKSRILHRSSKSKLPMIARGNGVYLIDSNGKQYLDACGGAAVSCLGHSNQTVKLAVKRQLDAIPYAHTSFFTSEVAEQLAEKLVNLAPENISKIYFVTGGSEANETALKLCRQYFVEMGQTKRRHFIAREQSYHGNTIKTLAVGGNEWRKQTFRPILPEAHLIEPCYEYRYRKAEETPEEYSQRAAGQLEEKILELGAENVAAFIAEPVVGATAGALTATPGYFKKIREICDQYGVLLIFDEVMCGSGRCGTQFACEFEDVKPDLITIAKGLGGGYQPIGATLISKQINDAIEQGSGFFQHGHTYLSHPCVCAAAYAVLEEINALQLLYRVKTKGARLKQALHAQFDAHPHVGNIRGRGLFLGIEFVQDKSNKQAFPNDFALDTLLKKAAMEEGLMIYPSAGTIDGKNGHHILIAPPFIIEDSHIDELIIKLSKALETALQMRPN